MDLNFLPPIVWKTACGLAVRALGPACTQFGLLLGEVIRFIYVVVRRRLRAVSDRVERLEVRLALKRGTVPRRAKKLAKIKAAPRIGKARGASHAAERLPWPDTTTPPSGST